MLPSSALWGLTACVRYLCVMASATRECLPRGCPAALWLSARPWEMALRETRRCPKLALKIRSPKSPRPSARRDARGRLCGLS